MTVTTLRTPAEILAHCLASRENFLDFTVDAIASYLPVEMFRELVKPDADLDGYQPDPLTPEHVIEQMRDYMDFAWGKVQNHKGLSANRSIDKLTAWVWLLGNDALLDTLRVTAYAPYGAPKLARICEHYSFPVPDDERLARMIRGLPCRPNCNEGCRS